MRPAVHRRCQATSDHVPRHLGGISHGAIACVSEGCWSHASAIAVLVIGAGRIVVVVEASGEVEVDEHAQEARPLQAVCRFRERGSVDRDVWCRWIIAGQRHHLGQWACCSHLQPGDETACLGSSMRVVWMAAPAREGRAHLSNWRPQRRIFPRVHLQAQLAAVVTAAAVAGVPLLAGGPVHSEPAAQWKCTCTHVHGASTHATAAHAGAGVCTACT